MAIFSRYIAGQFSRPSGRVGRWLIGPWLDRISRGTNALALEAMDLQAGDNVLEVGFGGGALLAELLNRGDGRVIGIDISPEMVARARRRFAAAPRFRLIQGSIDSLPLADSSIDKAVSVNNVYFWADIDAALAELARVLRPGGRLVLCFEPPEVLKKWHGHRHGFRLYEEGELRERMAKVGFDDFILTDGRGRQPDYFLCLTGRKR